MAFIAVILWFYSYLSRDSYSMRWIHRPLTENTFVFNVESNDFLGKFRCEVTKSAFVEQKCNFGWNKLEKWFQVRNKSENFL